MQKPKLMIQISIDGKEQLDDIIKKLETEYNVKADADFSNISVNLDKGIGKFNILKAKAQEFGLVMHGISRAWHVALAIIDKTIKKPIQTAGEFEQLQLRLESLYQDADRAAEAFEKFRQVAADTPATLKGVVEAGATLKAFGLEAEDTITAVADLAAYMGMDVVEAAAAMGRAFAGGVGAADILRERGVLNLIKDFKGIDDLTKLTLPEFREAMLSTFMDAEAGIAGSADRMSKSYAGAIANMEDSLETLNAKIGEAFTPAVQTAANAIAYLAEQFGKVVDAVNALTPVQKGVSLGLIVLNALVIKNAIATMGMRAEIAKLSTTQQAQIAILMANIKAQTLAQAATGKFSLILGGLKKAFIAAAGGVKAFMTSIGPVGWAIIGITAAYTALTAILKDNTAAQKDLYDAKVKNLQIQKEQIDKRIEEEKGVIRLTERYEQLATKSKRSASEQKELKTLHQQLSSIYPDLISATDSYSASLGGIQKAADIARRGLNQLQIKQRELSMSILMNEMESMRMEMLQTLNEEFTWWDKRDIFTGALTERRQNALARVDNAKKYLREHPIETDTRLVNLSTVMDIATDLKDDSRNLGDLEKKALYDVLSKGLALQARMQEYQRLLATPIKPIADTTPTYIPGQGSGSDTQKSQRESVEEAVKRYEDIKRHNYDEEAIEKRDMREKYQKQKELFSPTNPLHAQTLQTLDAMLRDELEKIEEKYKEKAAEAEKEHYEELKFYLVDYYDWKLKQIEEQAKEELGPLEKQRRIIENNALQGVISTEEKLAQLQNLAQQELRIEQWKQDQIKELNKAKEEWDRRPLAEFEKMYQSEMDRLADLRDLGLATYSDIAAKAWEYYEALKAIAEADGVITDEEEQLLAVFLKRAQTAQRAVSKDPDDIVKYYEQMKWQESGYYQWRKKEIEREVGEMADLTDEQKETLKKKLLIDLDLEQQDASQKGIFERLMGAVDIPPEIQKGILGAYQKLAAQIQSVWSSLYNYLDNRKQASLDALEKRAKKERRTDVWLAKEKEKIEEEYQKKQRQMKKMEQKQQIASATANTLEGITNALTIKPAWLSLAHAAAVGTLGFAQVALIAAQKFWRGGHFRGKGTTTSDSNIIAVSDQEYIISADRVNRFGVHFFDALNFGSGEQIRKALAGVKVPNVTVTYPMKAPGYASGGSVQPQKPGNVPLNLSMNVELKCDKKALAKAVIKGKKMILST
jgi:hypothetical protein